MVREESCSAALDEFGWASSFSCWEQAVSPNVAIATMTTGTMRRVRVMGPSLCGTGALPAWSGEDTGCVMPSLTAT